MSLSGVSVGVCDVVTRHCHFTLATNHLKNVGHTILSEYLSREVS